MKNETLREFQPAIKFVLIFVGVYFVGNILYGIWIENSKPEPDTMTVMVTNQTVSLLQGMNEPVFTLVNQDTPTISVLREGKGIVIRVFEGCNGINVMIVFVAFLAAFGGKWQRILWFVPMGLVVIHIANLLRVGILYYTAANQPQYFYYFHKYFFTAILYAIVFGLWFLWIRQAGLKIQKVASTEK